MEIKDDVKNNINLYISNNESHSNILQNIYIRYTNITGCY